MRELTQTRLKPGDCWQVAVACLLDLPAESLPDQVALEHPPEGTDSIYYLDALQAYLWKHHGLMYAMVMAPALAALQVREPGWHVIVGPTVRTSPEPGRRILHAVVGFRGEVFWDPHPSRAGLTEASEWGLLVPIPKAVEEERRAQLESGKDYWRGYWACRCPACAQPPSAPPG